MRLVRKLRKLETEKDYFSIQGNIPNLEHYEFNSTGKIPQFPSLKNLDLTYAAGKAW